MKTVIITGSSGLLGGNLCHLLSQKGYRVIGAFNNICVSIPGVEMVPIANLSLVNDIDFIIHCAAKTNVDECEFDPIHANEVNVLLTEQMVKLANKNQAVFIHISTDAVYKDSEQIKSENSELEPLSIYAKTKLRAEELVQQKAKKYVVIRTNLFGFNILDKKSLSEWVYSNLEQGITMNGFNDVFFSPILVNDMANALNRILEIGFHQENSVYNIGSVSGMSKFEFACRIADLFKLDKDLIRSTSVKDFGFAAPRSTNSIMDSSKFMKQYDYVLPTLEEGLRNYYKLFQDRYPQQIKTFKHQLC